LTNNVYPPYPYEHVREKFPLVLIGGIFDSKIILTKIKKEIRKIAPRVKFVRKQRPVIGSVRMAISSLKWRS